MNKKFLDHIACLDLKTSEYKIIILLLTQDYKQSDIVKILNLKKQNVNRSFKSLEKLGLIELKRTEGNNKYFGLVSPNKIIVNIPGQINFMMKG